jgi:hypothetical protein
MLQAKNKSNCLVTTIFGYSEEAFLRRLFAPSSKKSTKQTSHLVNVFTIFSVLCVIAMSLLLTLLNESDEIYLLMGLFAAFFVVVVINSIIISRQPQDHTIDSFKVTFELLQTLPYL